MEPSLSQIPIDQTSDSQTSNVISLLWMIWWHPRQAIRHILNKSPYYFWLQLISAYAISIFIGHILNNHMVITWGILEGIMYMFLEFYLMGKFLRWTGSLMGGKATYAQTQTAFTWILIPFMTGYIVYLFVPLLISISPIKGLLILIEDICAFWSLVIGTICIAQVHQFAIWKGLIALVVSIVILVAIMYILSSLGIF